MYSNPKYRLGLTLATGNRSLCINVIGLANSALRMTLIAIFFVLAKRTFSLSTLVKLYFHTMSSYDYNLWYNSTLLSAIIKRLV